jgi:hypothetical protein
VLDPLGEQRPVGQAGQAVVERLVDQLGFELLAVGDVAGVQHQAAHVGVLEQVGGHRLGVQPGPVAVADPPGLGRCHPRPQGRVGHEAGRPLAVVGVDQGEGVAVDQLARVVAKHPADRLAVVADGPVGVDDADHVRGVLDQGAEPLLAGPQGPLGRLALVHLDGEGRVRPGEVLADPLAQRQRQGQPDEQHQPAEPDQQALGALASIECPVDRPEQTLLLGVEELLDADQQPVGRRPHDRDLGPHTDPARVRLDLGQVAVDERQVFPGLRQGLRHLHVADLPLGLAELVDEQAAPDTDALQVTGGRQVLDLVLEQQRLALGVDQGAVQERLLAEDGGGAVDVGVGLEDQDLDDQDERHQRPAEGEHQGAAPTAQDAGGVRHSPR